MQNSERNAEYRIQLLGISKTKKKGNEEQTLNRKLLFDVIYGQKEKQRERE